MKLYMKFKLRYRCFRKAPIVFASHKQLIFQQLLYHSGAVVHVVNHFHPNGNLYIVAYGSAMP